MEIRVLKFKGFLCPLFLPPPQALSLLPTPRSGTSLTCPKLLLLSPGAEPSSRPSEGPLPYVNTI